jgi:signal transduction histidine kinase
VFGEFAMVAMMTPGRGGQWGFSWIEKGPLYSQLQTDQVMLTADKEFALLKSLPYDRIKQGDMHWQRLSDNSGRPVWALAISVETQTPSGATNPSAKSLPEGTDYRSVRAGTGGRAVVVGIFARNPLLSATDDFIGSTSTAFVIDSRGYAATHSNKAMVGALLRDEPAVKEIFSARASAGATRYQSEEKGHKTRVFSAFEQVDRTNLYVVMSTPETIAETGQSFGVTAVVTGGLALLVGLFLVFVWGAGLLPKAAVAASESTIRYSSVDYDLSGESSQKPPARMAARNEVVESLALPRSEVKSSAKAANLASVPSSASNLNHSSAQDRAAFIQSFVQGLEKSMKEPLLAALAHIQLAKSKTSDEPSKEIMAEILDHVSSVDRDIRRAKDLIDELGRLASEAKVPTSDRMDVHRVISDLIKREEVSFDQDGIKLKVSSSEVPAVKGRDVGLSQVMEELLKNARRSLSGRSDKSIAIQVEDQGEYVVVQVRDNGIGMDRDTRQQAFDPFFHTFQEPEARGLGLASVRMIVQSQGGTCSLSSTPGEGTTVTLQWPVSGADRSAFESGRTALASSNTISTGVDFSEEGAVALGGKGPLGAEFSSAFPPSPVPGVDEDDEDEPWSFSEKRDDGRDDRRDESKVESGGDDKFVKIRPVRRE